MARDGDDFLTEDRSGMGRWLAKLLLLLVVLVAFLWLAPWIVARTSLRNSIVPALVPQFDGTVTLASAHLDWFSPVQLDGVEITDATGSPLLQAEHLTCNKRLLDLVLRGAGDITVRIEQPQLVCRMRTDGSNIEDALQPLLDGQDSQGAPSEIRVEVVDGTIELRDEQDVLHGEFSALQLEMHRRSDGEAGDSPWAITVSSDIAAPQSEMAGKLSAEMSFRAAADGHAVDFGQGQGSLQADKTPLAAVEPLFRRFAPSYRIAGELNAELQGQWDLSGPAPRLEIAGKADGAKLSILAPVFGSEELQIAGVQSTLDLSWLDKRLDIRECNIDSDVAQIQLRGAINTDRLARRDVAALFGEDDYHLKGRVNLAQLAARLPGLVKLREDTHVTAGELTIDLISKSEQDTRRWQGSLVTRSLEATAAGRPIDWERPIEITFDAHQPRNGDFAGQLTCHSDFLEVTADGSLDAATISLKGDLDRLASDLRQLVDLGELEVRGTLDAGLQLNREAEGRFDANGHVLLQQFELALPGRLPLREERLTIAVDVGGAFEAGHLRQLDHGSIRLVSGGDRMDVSLRSAVSEPGEANQLPLAAQLSGQLASWLPRLQPWLSLDDWRIGGAIQLQASGTLAHNGARLDQADITVRQLRATDGQITIDEPQVIVSTSGRWDRATGVVESELTSVASSSVALRADKLAITLPSTVPERGLDIGGEFTVRGDLAGMQAWFADTQREPAHRLNGRLDGVVQFAGGNDQTGVQWQASIQDLVLSRRQTATARSPVPVGRIHRVQPVVQSGGWMRVWNEAKISTNGSGSYLRHEDRVELRDVEVNSKLLRLQETTGRIERLSADAMLDLSGQARYDLATLSRLLAPYVGGDLRLFGQGTRGFRVSGPLTTDRAAAGSSTPQPWWTDFNAEAGVGWSSIEAYGLVAGQGDLQGHLVDGIVKFDPLQVAFSDGHLRTTPELRLTSSSPVLVLSSGRTIESARITPELCRSWLQYVTPLLANATRAEGQFSLDLERAVVPLGATHQSDLAGTLTIHSAQVRPGPASEQLVSLARQVEALIRRRPLEGAVVSGGGTELDIETQQVPFSVTEGRVHHRGFRVQIGDVAMQTSGSVGMDSTLDLVAEIPVRDQWIERDPYLRGLKGQTLRVPISGTLSRPRLDKRVLADLTRQMAGSAASGLLDDALQDGLQKGLEGLLKRKP